jgi:PAS domain S-box-containing protein
MTSSRVTRDSVITYPEGSGRPGMGADLNVFYEELPSAYQSLDAKGRIIYVNGAWLEMFGYARDDVIGKTFRDLLAPDYVNVFDENFAKFKEAGKISGAEFEMVRKDGGRIFVSFDGVWVCDKNGNLQRTNCIAKDVSQRKMVEGALMASEIRYRRLFEAAKDGILIIDADSGVILQVNPFLETLLGYPHEELLGKQLWEIGLFTDRVASKDAFLELQRKGYVRYEDLPLETKDGRQIDVEFVSNVYTVDPIKVVQCNIRDITERKKKAEELSTANEQLTVANQRLTAANQQLQAIEQQLRASSQSLTASEARFRALFDNMGSGVAVYEPTADGEDFIVRSLNKAGEEQTKSKVADILGRNITEAFPGVKEMGLFEVLKRVSVTGVPEQHPTAFYDDKRLTAFYENFVYRLPAGEVVAIFTNVTEQKRNQEALEAANQQLTAANQQLSVAEQWLQASLQAVKDSEERFRSIFEESPIGAALSDPETSRFLRVNGMFCQMLGYTENEFVIMSFKDITLQEFIQQDVENIRRLAAEEISVYRTEKKYVKKGGGSLWASTTVSAIRDADDKILYYLAMVEDITERKEAEEELRTSKSFTEGIVNTTPDLLYIYDLVEHRNLYSNKEITAVLGYPPQEVKEMGSRLFEIILHPDDAAKVAEHHAKCSKLKQGEALEVEYRMRHSEGKWCWLFSRDTPYEFGADGIVKQIIGAALDITEHKQMEAELKEYSTKLESMVAERTRELEAANKEIKRLFEAKTQFVSQLSHDLRTPLTPILALMPQIGASQQDEKNRERFDVVNRNVEYMRKLVTEALNLAKLDSSTLVLNKSQVDLAKTVETLKADHAEEFEKAKISFEMDIPAGLMLSADELRLKEVLDNLIGNSIKYSPDGGKLTLTARMAGNETEVSVKDEGIGVEEKELQNIFLEFYKVDTSRHDLHSTGLGLAICKRIVELHGGRIWAESEGLGKGTTIRFTLPLA